MVNNGQSTIIMEDPNDKKIDAAASEANDFLAKQIKMNGNDVYSWVKHVVHVYTLSKYDSGYLYNTLHSRLVRKVTLS